MRKFLFLPLLMLLAGCAGYHVGPVKPAYLKNVRTIGVPTFRNATLIPRLEVMTANCVIKQLQNDGTFQVAPVEEADAILQGTVTSVQRQPYRSLAGNVLATTEFNLEMRIDYTLTDRLTGKVLAKHSVIGSSSFFVGGDVQQDEQQALPLAADKAAVQIVTSLSEGW
ncbi:MAG TPA: LptE family protein [Chthoniobacteraceae bacterium]|nr:LptE family protein [Chthoniobacteraceae bacterium]